MMFSFKLLSLTINKGCNPQIIKNLSEGITYTFCDSSIPFGFFRKSVNVSAIVGKNGCGKSTLLDIMFRLINNLGVVLYRKEIGNLGLYVRGIYAVLIYEVEETQARIICADDEIGISCGRFKYAYSLSGKFEKYKDFENYNNLASRKGKDILFYNIGNYIPFTIVSNYSIQSLNPQDYLGEDVYYYNAESEELEETERWIKIDDYSWVEAIYQQNIDYCFPLILLPNRKNGLLNLKQYQSEIEDQLGAILIMLRYKNKQLLKGYNLNHISYQFNDSYFLSLSGFKFQDPKLRFYFQPDGINPKSVPGLIMSKLGLTLNNEKTLQIKLKIYLIYLVLSVSHSDSRFREYALDINYIYSNDVVPYNISDMIGRLCNKILNFEFASFIEIKKIYTLLNSRGVNWDTLSDSFTEDVYLSFTKPKKLTQLINNISLARFTIFLPPSIFKPTFYFDKVKARENGPGTFVISKNISINDISAGEKQFIYSSSAIFYHTMNLLRRHKEYPKHAKISIILDEVELCFHPEYQQSFLNNFLESLCSLNLRDGMNYNIIIVTHSPFILSDIPRSNILFLKENGIPATNEKMLAFGANIHSMLKSSFFLSKGTMGLFAKSKIRIIISKLNFLSIWLQIQDIKTDIEKYSNNSSTKDDLLEEEIKYLFDANDSIIKTIRKSWIENPLEISKEKALTYFNPKETEWLISLIEEPVIKSRLEREFRLLTSNLNI